MSRKTKKLQKELNAFIAIITLFIGSVILNLTKSLMITGIIVGLIFTIFLFVLYYIEKKRKQRLRESGIEEIDKMDGIIFEHYLKHLYSSQGYKAEVTRPSGDFGGDLLLSKGGKKIVVQAKRHVKDVGIKAVQEVIGAKSYYSSDEAWVVSNSFFTKAAVELAEKSRVKLVDREQLIDMLLVNNVGAIPQSQPVIEMPVSNNLEKICSKCGNPMVLRNGKKGPFWGCSSFPKCRSTENVG